MRRRRPRFPLSKQDAAVRRKAGLRSSGFAKRPSQTGKMLQFAPATSRDAPPGRTGEGGCLPPLLA